MLADEVLVKYTIGLLSVAGATNPVLAGITMVFEWFGSLAETVTNPIEDVWLAGR